VRPIGFTLILVVAPWILWALPSRARPRAITPYGCSPCWPRCLFVGAGYVLVQRAPWTGYTGITQDSGPDSVCPSGQVRRLLEVHPSGRPPPPWCETTPIEQARQLQPVPHRVPRRCKRKVTPGGALGESCLAPVRSARPPPTQSLQAFGIGQRILHQPLDYIGQIAGRLPLLLERSPPRVHHQPMARVDPRQSIRSSPATTGLETGVSSDGLGFSCAGTATRSRSMGS